MIISHLRILRGPDATQEPAGWPVWLVMGLGELRKEIEGPDNPTSQLLPISRNKKFQRDGEGRIDKGGGGGSMSSKAVCEELCVTKMCVKDGV